MAKSAKTSLVLRFLGLVERFGNALPDPVSIFAVLTASVVVSSALLDSWSAVHPSTGKVLEVVNLLTADGLRRVMTSLVSNFTSFAPLGTVLVALLGVGVAEGSGLLSAALRSFVLAAPRRWIPFAVVLAGVLSNAASELGYVVLIPLAAIVFSGVGRHPLAGMAAAFAGVSGGYSANLILGTVDPLLAGITQEAARLVDSTYEVSAAANYFFMAASTFFVALAGTWVTVRIVEPRLGPPEKGEDSGLLKHLTRLEKRGLLAAAATNVILVALTAWAVLPEDGILRDPQTGSILHSPFLNGIVAIIFVFFAGPGLVYGLVVRAFRRDSDVVASMNTAMKSMASYIVLAFFAAQFVSFFGWTNIGVISAIKGAELLRAVNLTGIPLIVAFVALSGLLNLAISSASAKWAIMAPVFVPMFMLLGYSPELTQAAYRVGDSITNIITPMMSYFPLILVTAQKYRRDAAIGTFLSMMLPYSVTFGIIWTLLLLVWMLAGLPLGPGAPLFLK